MIRALTLTAAVLLSAAAWPAAGVVVKGADCVIDPRSTIEVGTAEEGIISEIAVDRVQRVKKGDVLAALNADLEAAQVRLARRRAASTVDVDSNKLRLKYRDQELERVLKLFEKKVASSQRRDEAEIERGLARFAITSAELERDLARIELERAKIRLARRTVRSPVDGIVTEVRMAPGEYAHKQAVLLLIAEMDPLNVSLFLPIERFGDVAVGMTGTVFPEAPVGGENRVKVTVVDSVFDAASRTFGLRLELPNPDMAIPAGLRCKVDLDPSSTPD